VKSNSKKTSKTTELREQILKSLIASFKIEGIEISNKFAEKSLKKVELKLEK